MRIKKQGLDRRTIIERYAAYDCWKNSRSLPTFATWDWSRADAIDQEMDPAGLKIGVPAGYLLWDEIEVTMSDLLECAIYDKIFEGQSRKLGLIDAGELHDWTLRCNNSWYPGIARGEIFDETALMLFRPAVSGESPALFYIEDGSGRATAFVANKRIFDPSQTLAIGYLGRKPDLQSTFMREKFPELLCR
jgi:hypothetical protein